MLLRTVARINPRFFITNRVSIKRFVNSEFGWNKIKDYSNKFFKKLQNKYIDAKC